MANKLKKPVESFASFKVKAIKSEYKELAKERLDLKRYLIKLEKKITRNINQAKKWNKIMRDDV